MRFASCARFAFLYAGSNEFLNYRHQADIFTIYKQLLNRGFTKENIALYAYDDIATIKYNPFQGQVFHTIDHKINVYPGTDAINVKGADVDDQSFYNAIINLPTTSEDYVFIYYDNHGGPGILGTPDADEIYADKLAKSFSIALKNNLYKQCLFVIEACYSGSVAEVITVPNFASITAANDQESSYAVTYDSEIGAYLSNEFTNHFIDLIDETPSITIGDLYTKLKSLTEESHACYYGDESIQSISISTFIGTPNQLLPKTIKIHSKPVTQREASEQTLLYLSQHSKPKFRAISRLQILRRKIQKQRLELALEMIVKYVDTKNYEQIMKDTKTKITPTYFQVLRIFLNKFGKINPDDYDRLNILKALSASHSKDEIIQGIFSVKF